MNYTIENDVLFFDTETTGLPPRGARWDVDFEYFPKIVSIAWIYKGVEHYHIIKPVGYVVPEEATKIHGITHEYAMQHGEDFEEVMTLFFRDALEATFLCIHNAGFDTQIAKAQVLAQLPKEFFEELQVEKALYKGKRLDTMYSTIKFVAAKYADGRVGKFPRLEELFAKIYPGVEFTFHNSLGDCQAMLACLPFLLEQKIMALEIREYDESGKPIKKIAVAPIEKPKEVIPEKPKQPIVKRTGIIQKPIIEFHDPNPVTDPSQYNAASVPDAVEKSDPPLSSSDLANLLSNDSDF